MNPTWEDPLDDEDEESAYDKSVIHGRDSVIFLIDATEEMFQKHTDESGEEELLFSVCMKCVRTSVTNKIISNHRDLQAVVLFGTEKSKGLKSDTEFKHIYVVQDLDEPGAERVLEIEELMSMDKESFDEKYGHSKDFLLADALWTCSLIFASSPYNLGHKRVLLFTSTDNPHPDNPQLQMQAKIKAKDMADNNIDVDLMHLHRPDTIFDVSRFYKDIMYSTDSEDYKLPDPSEKFEDLLTRVRAKDHKKRPLSTIHFSIGDGLQIAVSIYKLVVSTPKPTAAKLCKENNALLRSFTKTFLSDTGEILLPSDIKKFQEYGGKKIYLTEDEVKQVRRIAEPGLRLMGFKPVSFLKVQHHIRPSLFAYPNEKVVAGSTQLFFALLMQCQKRGYMPICRLVLRQNDPPKFVGLLPQEENVDERGSQTIPPGFHVVYFPFMEDIRHITPEPKHHPSESLVEKAKEIIKKLQFAYHPESFENPVLQKHWRNIEALALNKDAPEEITDYTLPTKDIIEKRAGKLIDEFKALLCPGQDSGEKRQMGGYGQSAKKARLDDAIIPVNLLSEATSGQLGKYKVSILKEFCKRNGIRCGTKKAEIIDAIKEYYDE